MQGEGRVGPRESDGVRPSVARRVARTWTAATRPSSEITEPEERRKARMVCNVALMLCLILTIAAVISLGTSTFLPDPDQSLGYGGTAIVALAGASFWLALWRCRQPRYVIGAWWTILTINAFLLALAPFFPEISATLAVGFAAPVLCATLFLDARGTLIVFVLSAVLGTLFLLVSGPTLAEGAFIIAIMAVVTVLTVIVSYVREDDLRSIKRLRSLEQRDAERLKNELELARKVQRSMLPAVLPEIADLEIAAHSESAFEASGDFYDVFHIGDDDDRLGVVVCDVAGKGVASALVMSATRAALRAEAQRAESPAAVLARVNDTLASSIPAGLFVTIFYGVYESGSRVLRFSSAGHPHPYRGNPDRAEVEELESFGLPLGLVAGSEYEDRSVVLEPGDFVVAYTDGVVEALNGEREMYGFDAMRQRVAADGCRGVSAQELLDLALEDMYRFVSGERLHDDVTLVSLRVLTADTTLVSVDAGDQGAMWTGGD